MPLRAIYVSNSDKILNSLIERGYIYTSTVERALRSINSKLFACKPCISSTVLKSLVICPGHKFLNIGSENGYLNTLAGLLLGSIGVNHGIEVNNALVNIALEKLDNFKLNSAAIDHNVFCEPVMHVFYYQQVYCRPGVPPEHIEFMKSLIKVMDIILYCIDPTQLKVCLLSEVSPAIRKFLQVSHCSTSRRIAVGTKNGHIALYELRSSKCQTINAHVAAISACAFSPDGKFLVSYSAVENKLSFWKISTGMFGLGNSQTKCIKSYSTQIQNASRSRQLRQIKIHWASNRSVRFLSDGLETSIMI